jgi:hypothetical protein
MDNLPGMLVTDDNSDIRSRFSKFFPGYNPYQYTTKKNKLFWKLLFPKTVVEFIDDVIWFVDLGHFEPLKSNVLRSL